MNRDALIVWKYLFETIRRDRNGAATNHAFTQLLLDMREEYPVEFGYVLGTFKLEE